MSIVHFKSLFLFIPQNFVVPTRLQLYLIWQFCSKLHFIEFVALSHALRSLLAFSLITFWNTWC